MTRYAKQDASGCRPKTILVADDEKHILNLLDGKLRHAGFRVITATNGAKAFELACAYRPDLVIADFQMPLLSGLELCSKLRCQPQTRQMPAILLTAPGFRFLQSDPETDNIKNVIIKPFTPCKVLTTVLFLVGQNRMEMESANGRGGT